MGWKRDKWSNYYQKQVEWEQKKMNYKDYLLSDNWAEKRDKLFELVGRNCELCKSDDYIQVHHLTYKRLYRENASDLMVVCCKCHEIVDWHRKKYRVQEHFAYWVHENYGHGWRGNVSMLDMVKTYVSNNYKDVEMVENVFGVELNMKIR